MYPILFQIGPITIYSHGIMVALGILAGGFIIFRLAKIEGLKTAKLFDIILYSLIAALVGGRLLYVAVYPYQFSSFWDVLAVWQGGMVSYGGIVAGLTVAIYLLYKQKENVWRWLDIFVVALIFGWGIGRIGCLLAGDIIGKITNSGIGMRFPAIDENTRHPVALYESITSIVIFGVLYFLFQVRNLKDGILAHIGLILFFAISLFAALQIFYPYFSSVSLFDRLKPIKIKGEFRP
ncbi:unnamed protein product, partial [marine sediment metagenome]